MNFDTQNTGDNWDSYVPESAGGEQPAAPAQQFTQQNYAASPGKPKRGGMGAGLIVRAVAVVGVLGFGGIAALGSTSANDLGVGDCLNMPGDDEFASVDTEGCDSAHDSQIYAIVNLFGPETYPGQTDPYWEQVVEVCAERLETAIVRMDDLPGDVTLEFFLPTEEAWNANERDSSCLIWAPSGLEGSFVDPSLISS